MTDKDNPQPPGPIPPPVVANTLPAPITLRDAVRLGDVFKLLARAIAKNDKLDLTQIEIPENPFDFEAAITRWVRMGECPTDASETTAAASAALLNHEGAPAQLEILDPPEYGSDTRVDSQPPV